MFTGIIEESGIIKSISKSAQGAVISVQCSKVLSDLKIGDSVAINGACQTAVKIGNDYFEVEAAPETLKLTNLGDLKVNQKVNLERAMSASGRFGGHFVTGHIEGFGSLQKIESQGLAQIYYFSAPESILKYLVNKGSICIDGISLTIVSVNNDIFTVSVIPHTLNETTLSELKIGDKVNLESDIIAKYIEKMLNKDDNKAETITLDYLQEHGFYE